MSSRRLCAGAEARAEGGEARVEERLVNKLGKLRKIEGSRKVALCMTKRSKMRSRRRRKQRCN